jgi:hypothetical protein
MFATFDNEPTRVVQVHLTLDGTDLRAPSRVLGDRAVELRTLPSESELRAAAEELLKKRWTVVDGLARVAAEGEDGEPATSARVGVVGLQLSGPSDRPVVSTMPIRSVEVDAE